jgi:hypothetical protein
MSPLQPADPVPGDALATIAASTFVQMVGVHFTLAPAPGVPALALRLARVTPVRMSGGFEQFSLIFEGPAEPLLAQATYELSHEVAGRLALFIVPIARRANGVEYEACIARTPPRAAP